MICMRCNKFPIDSVKPYAEYVYVPYVVGVIEVPHSLWQLCSRLAEGKSASVIVVVVLISEFTQNSHYHVINSCTLLLYMVRFAKRMSVDLRHVHNTRDDNWVEK